MTSTTEYASGWGRYEHMSPAMRARCLADDRQHQETLRKQERQQAIRTEMAEERRLRGAIEQAELEGLIVNPAEVWRTGGASLGRTRAEAVAHYSALADLQEARERRAKTQLPDPVQRHELMLRADPRAGRTKAEALAYFSAVQDLEDIEAQCRAYSGLPTVDQEAANRALLEQRKEQVRQQCARALARTAAETVVFREREGDLGQRFAAGDLTEEEYLVACERLADRTRRGAA